MPYIETHLRSKMFLNQYFIYLIILFPEVIDR